MAPFLGPDRATVLKFLRAWSARSHLPLTLGLYAPQAVIQYEDGVFTLRPLVLDQERAAAAGREALAAGGSWMPEMEWRYLAPGAPIVQATSAKQLADEIEQLAWIWS